MLTSASCDANSLSMCAPTFTWSSNTSFLTRCLRNLLSGNPPSVLRSQITISLVWCSPSAKTYPSTLNSPTSPGISDTSPNWSPNVCNNSWRYQALLKFHLHLAQNLILTFGSGIFSFGWCFLVDELRVRWISVIWNTKLSPNLFSLLQPLNYNPKKLSFPICCT